MRSISLMLVLLLGAAVPAHAGNGKASRAEVLDRLNAVIEELEAADEALRPKPKPKPKQKVKKVAHTLRERVRDAVLKLPRPLRTVIDVRSTHSDGKHSFAQLYQMAHARGVEVLAFTEHDRTAVRYGIDPVAGILGYTYERPSLYTTGVEKFFRDLNEIRLAHPRMIFLAGTESTPGYHWTGIPFRGDFVLHGSDKHIIALGVERPRQVEALPSYRLSHMHSSLKLSVVFWTVSVFLLMLFLLYRRRRAVALLLFASFVAFMATWLMQLRHEKDADLDFLQTARKEKLFTIWAHPGTRSGMRTEALGVKVETEPYSDKVFDGPHADAFAALYGDSDHNCSVGGPWDRYLQKYLRGEKKRPLWAVAAGDFHYQGGFGLYLGDYPMDVWVREHSPAGVLMALQEGHAVAWQQTKGAAIRVRALGVSDGRGKVALPGDSIQGPGPFFLVVALAPVAEAEVGRNPESLVAQVVADGLAIDAPSLPVGSGKSVAIPLDLKGGDHVVRLRIPEQGGIRMEANPFFIRVKGGKR